MNGVEIIFITSVLTLLIIWIWFIVQGFRTSRSWGASIIFLFPISPFLFAYRFERKTRQAIYYFIGSLVFFIAVMLYIHFATIDFFSRFSDKLSSSVPSRVFSSTPKVKLLNLPKPTPIPPPLAVAPPPKITTEITKAPVQAVTMRRYKTVDIGSVKSYLGKSVIITTATVKHNGKLMSVDGSQLEIKKDMGGGSIIMGIKKSKIEKVEVYF